MNQRFYQASDIAMLTACDVIADHALENLAALEGINSAWDEAFFRDLKKRILTLLREVFGIKSIDILKEATAGLVTLQTELLNHLTMLRKQIITAYRGNTARQKEVLSSLGYTAYWSKANAKKSQTALITMLELFEKGCTPVLLEEFAAKKVSGTSVSFVRNNLHRMFELNVVQEGKKSSRKLITADVVEKFNAIYNDTMLYAGSAKTLFKRDPIRLKEFTFSHVVKQLSGGSSNGTSGNDGDTPKLTE